MTCSPLEPPLPGPARLGRPRSRRAHLAILTAARELLADTGYRRLTMESVAVRAGVAKATLYRWWPNKSALCVEVLRAQLAAPAEATGDTDRDLRTLIAATAEMLTGLFGEMLLADVGDDPDTVGHLEEVAGPHQAAHAAILLSASSRGDLPYDIDTVKVLDLLSGTILLRRVANRPVDSALVDELATLLRSGELPRSGRRL